MPEQNYKCADVVPDTIIKASVAIEMHKENEKNMIFDLVTWVRSIIGKALIDGSQAE